MPSWKRNLIVVWISQFCGLLGFGMALPFAPYYIQTLGITSDDAIKFWSGVFVAAACLPLAIMGPIWGMLSDRYGRKPMLLRANVCAAVIIFLMGTVQNVQMLILLRVLQGALSGTVTASITLVIASTPNHHHGSAMGWLNAAVFCGMTTAAVLGGFLADLVGYRITFFASSSMLLLAAIIIWAFAHEEFEAPTVAWKPLRERWSARLSVLGPAMPILVILTGISFARRFDVAMFPLLVQEIRGGELAGSASVTGGLNAAAAVGAMLSGLIFGKLCDRWSATLIGRVTALGAGAFLLVIGLSHSFSVIFPARFAMYFFAGGMDPMFQALLSRTTSPERRGTVMGLTVTARAIGWLFAPMASQYVARELSLRAVFFLGPLLFLALVPLITLMARRLKRAADPGEPATIGSPG